MIDCPWISIIYGMADYVFIEGVVVCLSYEFAFAACIPGYNDIVSPWPHLADPPCPSFRLAPTA